MACAVPAAPMVAIAVAVTVAVIRASGVVAWRLRTVGSFAMLVQAGLGPATPERSCSGQVSPR